MKPQSLFLKSTLFAFFVCAEALAGDVAHHTCVQPVIPQALAQDYILKLFDRKTTTYKDCINKFIDEQRKIYQTSNDVATANLAHDAAETAIKEYNNFLEQVNERNKRAGKHDGDDD